MKITEQHVYTQPVADVYEMFTNRAQLAAKHEALGARKVEIVSCRRTAKGATVEFVRELPADVPGFLKRFLQPWNRVTQHERWTKRDDGYRAELEIAIDNVPVDVRGTLHLHDDDGGAINDIALTVECPIPFVGGKLADFIGRDCRRLIAAEYRYIRENLA